MCSLYHSHTSASGYIFYSLLLIIDGCFLKKKNEEENNNNNHNNSPLLFTFSLIFFLSFKAALFSTSINHKWVFFFQICHFNIAYSNTYIASNLIAESMLHNGFSLSLQIRNAWNCVLNYVYYAFFESRCDVSGHWSSVSMYTM